MTAEQPLFRDLSTSSRTRLAQLKHIGGYKGERAVRSNNTTRKQFFRMGLHTTKGENGESRVYGDIHTMEG